jgi:hypothetical protein
VHLKFPFFIIQLFVSSLLFCWAFRSVDCLGILFLFDHNPFSSQCMFTTNYGRATDGKAGMPAAAAPDITEGRLNAITAAAAAEADGCNADMGADI